MAFAAAGFADSFVRPKTTQAPGTVITSLCRPKGHKRTKLTLLAYADTGTAHDVVFMTPLAKTTVYATVAGGATSIVLARDPGSYAANATLDGQPTPSVADNLIAANDYLVIKMPDGNFHVTKPSAVATASGRVTCTVAALPTGGILAGAEVWFLGISTDTNPRTGEAHTLVTAGAGTSTVTFGDGSYSIAETPGQFEPILIYSANATNAGTLHRAYGYYGP